MRKIEIGKFFPAILIFLALCFQSAPGFAQLSKEVQADLLQREIVQSLNAENYQRAQQKIKEYRTLGVNVPPAVEMIDAKIAVVLEQYRNARRILEGYFNKHGSSDDAYQEALSLYEQAGSLATAQRDAIIIERRNKLRMKAQEYSARCFPDDPRSINKDACFQSGWLFENKVISRNGKTSTVIFGGDIDNAVKHYRKGCFEASADNSCARLASLYLEGAISAYSPPGDADVPALLSRSCFQSYLNDACFALGRVFLLGSQASKVGASTDLEKGMKAWDKGCRTSARTAVDGEARKYSCIGLRILYTNSSEVSSFNVPRDTQRANSYYPGERSDPARVCRAGRGVCDFNLNEVLKDRKGIFLK